MKLKEILDSTELLNTTHFTGTDKNTTHGFIDFFYEREFEKYKDKKISLLEIGMEVGGSIYLWGKYFQNGEITGVDVEDKIHERWKSLPNTKFIINDAYEIAFIETLPNFDIIIDDGPHTLDSQILCIERYLPKLKEGGIMVIEDVQDVSHLEILKRHTPLELQNKTEMIDLRFSKGRYDDLLFVIRK
jgi:hypothetical protein